LQPPQPAPRLPVDPSRVGGACDGGPCRVRPQPLERRRCDRRKGQNQRRRHPNLLPVRPAAADGPSARKSASGFSVAGACGRGTCPQAACCRREDCPQRIPVAVRETVRSGSRTLRAHGTSKPVPETLACVLCEFAIRKFVTVGDRLPSLWRDARRKGITAAPGSPNGADTID